MLIQNITSSTGLIKLGSLLGQGGEGAVYEVKDSPTIVAKIYLNEISSDRSEKLVAMNALTNPKLKSLTAWPIDLLRKQNGKVAGFLMPNIHGSKDIHTLYSPKSRYSEFPNADWRFLVRVALNTSRAFAELHNSGCLVADVNHGGIRVAKDATVRLIDCDSFQINSGGRIFLCEVGVDNYIAPELQGKPFKTTIRTQNQDNFGLAILVFQILMMGRHPFAGRYLGSEDMPIPKAISQYRYAYSIRKSDTRMELPPNTAPVLVASNEIVDLWEKAFSPNGSQLNSRPSAMQWVKALESIENHFIKCNRNSAHYYLTSYGKCPWCPIEQIGIVLFGLPETSSIGSLNQTINVDEIWRQIIRIRRPTRQVVPAIPSNFRPSAAALSISSGRTIKLVLGSIVGISIFFVGLFLSPDWFVLWAIIAFFTWNTIKSGDNENIKPFIDQHEKAKANFASIVDRCQKESGASQFDLKLSDLTKMRDELINLPEIRRRRHEDLVANKRKFALDEYLDRHEIERATISGIGEAKKAMLESFGIETAKDVNTNHVMNVPGFGPALTKKLLDWRCKVERSFKFNPASGVDQRLIVDLDKFIANRKTDLIVSLRKGPSELQNIVSRSVTQNQAHSSALQEAAKQLAQATADRTAVSRR